MIAVSCLGQILSEKVGYKSDQSVNLAINHWMLPPTGCITNEHVEWRKCSNTYHASTDPIHVQVVPDYLTGAFCLDSII